MPALNDILFHIPDFLSLSEKIDSNRAPNSLITGVLPIHKAHIVATLIKRCGRKGIVVCPDETSCTKLCSDINSFLGEDLAVVLHVRDFVFHNVEAVSREWEQKRLAALYGFLTGRFTVLVTSAESLQERTLPADVLSASSFSLELAHNYSLDELASKLIRAGYRRSLSVEGVGQFCIRGGILDFFSPAEPNPVRAEFFGNEIDSLSYFDVDSQRRTDSVRKALILPVLETLPAFAEVGIEGLISSLRVLCKSKGLSKNAAVLKTIELDIDRFLSEGMFPAVDRYMSMIYSPFSSAIDFAPEDALVFVDDHARVRQSAKYVTKRANEDVRSLLEEGLVSPNHSDFWLGFSEFSERIHSHQTIILDAFPSASYEPPVKCIANLSAKQLPSYSGSLDSLISDVSHYSSSGYSVLILAASQNTAHHLQELLNSNGIAASVDLSEPFLPPKSSILISVRKLSAGFEYPLVKTAVIAEGQPAAASTKRKKPSKRSAAERIRSYSDLTPGDLVVHEHHGIGRFSGIERMTVDGFERDYIKLAFAGTDSLYLPASSLDLISKFIGAGGEDAPVRLNKLGGSEWQKAKSKAKGAAKDLAKKLIQLYAERQKLDGYAFPKDDDWQREFEEAFEYEETEDQLRCTAEIKADMEKTYPMDRLLCGDVGFGKTEVAFRAVMKCVLGGKQAALLVPTTVLARQHYLTAMRRFEGYPVKVEMLSRFRTPKELKKSLSRIKSGSADLCIGTHRLIQKDVVFRDLGLLIIDEEQRFGVTHKERLKEISHKIDVLTLTATPIPRTLNMALSGIRDMSVLEEAPRDRYPVQTYVLEHEPGLLFEAIRRELSRGGQVYYLHNHIESIDRTAAKIREALSDAVIEVAHGKMQQTQLNDIMGRMSDGSIDVLVCTTIIETGLDIPNVNTLIIENADTFGLSQLHQIRGRVGRSPRHAFAYFTYRRGKVLSEIAQKRLSAIREFAEFGSGFKIAMRDLEIRGAGNVLGSEQSGHMMSVGYDMYLKLLEEAVITEQGGTVAERVECSADFSVNANIPQKYVPDAGQRVDLYRRIAMVKSEDDREDLIDELIDRFGDPPPETLALLDIALLRFEASEAGITELSQKDNRLILVFRNPDFMRISLICAEASYKGRILLNAGESPYISLKLPSNASPLSEARRLISAYTASR